MNEDFPKGETRIYLPDERILFEIGITKEGDIDFIVGIGEDKIVMRTTPTGAINLGEYLHNAAIRAMAIATGRGDDPMLDAYYPMPETGVH
jgi:hypothetical protein